MRTSRRDGMMSARIHHSEDPRFQLRQHFIEMQHLCCPWKLFETFRDRVRRNNRAQFRLLDGRFDRFARAGEVQIHRHFVRERDGEIGDDRAFSCRQHDADALFVVMIL